MSKQTPKLTRTEIKHTAILNAAKQIFIEKGFKYTSMDEIANIANVSKKTIYDHFNSKEQLFHSVLSQHWQNLSLVKKNLFTEQKSLADNLKHFAQVFLQFIYQKDTVDLFRLFIAETPHFPTLVSNLVVAGKPPFTHALICYLNQQQALGAVQLTNVERATTFFIGMLKEYHFWPMMMGFNTEKQLPDQEDLINEVVHIFLTVYAKVN